MAKNWKSIAEGNGVHVPPGELEKFAPALSALDEAFRKLVPAVAFETEPAIILSPDAVDPQ